MVARRGLLHCNSGCSTALRAGFAGLMGGLAMYYLYLRLELQSSIYCYL